VHSAAVQLVGNLCRSAERIQSFKQVALDQSQLCRRLFDAGELSEQVLSHLDRQPPTSAVALNLHCGPDLAMDSYPGPFGQALTHLVINALTHAFPDRGRGKIDISVSSAGPDDIEVLVADDGCGMTSEVKRLAFDPFFTTRRQYGAAGLGLHTVHNIVVERLGGQISLESEGARGTSVRLTLPRTAP
jgi:signal transduction histidine kinase